MKALRCLSVAALAAVVLAPAALAGGRNPGSVLIYPVHRSGTNFFTLISVTNSNLQPSTPFSFGGSTSVHFEYVNTNNTFGGSTIPSQCVIFDRVEFLTPADTLSVVTKCHNATAPFGQAGYLVVSAEDPSQFQTRWSHNYLMGSALVVNASGGMYSVGAIPFDAVSSSVPPVDHEATDKNSNGMIDFDGIEYEKVADIMYIDSFIALAGSQLALVNLEGGPSARNTLNFRVWNDNEFQLSATKTMGCWFDVPLIAISNLFSSSFLSFNTPNDPSELDINCDGLDDLETGWASIDSIGVTNLGGQLIAADGAVLGSITAGVDSVIDGGELLWESVADNPDNGAFLEP